MILKARLTSAVLVFFLLVVSAAGQSGGGVPADMKERVLDFVFRSDAVTSPFLSKMTLRFGDTNTQIVVLTYRSYPVHPGGQAEAISYTITGMGNDSLSQFISKTVAQNPNVTEQEIAAKLKVEVKRSPIRREVLSRFLDDLKAIRISPVLKSRVAMDDVSEYEYWYDTGSESVHYKVVGPFKDDPQDKLVQWMIRFRTGISGSVNAASVKP